MKLSISLATLAISTLASAYCVSPSSQPTEVEEQDVFAKSLRVPGQNRLEFCSSEFEHGPIRLINVDMTSHGPPNNGLVEVNIHGFLHVPLMYGSRFRMFDWRTRQDISEPVEYFRLMHDLEVPAPVNPGPFNLRFQFRPESSRIIMREIGIELFFPGGPTLLCVKSPFNLL